MSDKFARLLNTTKQVDDFLTVTLGLDSTKLPPNVNSLIITCETGVLTGILKPTLTHSDVRDKIYHDEDARLELRKKIIEELFTKTLLRKDDHIVLGKGGALPKILKRKEGLHLNRIACFREVRCCGKDFPILWGCNT